MGTTANRSYPYPDPTDPADMAGGLQALAEAVDTDVEALVSLTNAAVPFCVVTRDDFQLVTTGVATPLIYDEATYDNDSMANLALDNSGITPPTAGLYFVHASTRCQNVSSQLEMFLRVGTGSGTDFGRAIHQGDAPAQPRLVVSGMVSLNGTERVWATITENFSPFPTVFGNRLVAYKIA